MTPQFMQTYLPYLIALPIIGLVVVRNMRGRRLRLEALWIFPALLLVMGGLAFSHLGTPSPIYLVAVAVAAVVGGLLGWMRGRLMSITVDPETHQITAQASPVAIVFILVLFAVRFGARIVLGENVTALHMSLEQLSDLFLALLIGLLVVMRVEMWLRASRLLAEARAAT